MAFNFAQALEIGQQLLEQHGGGEPMTRDEAESLNPEGPARGKAAQDVEERPHFEANGNRRALLIGCNYVGQKGELRGCINDVQNLKELLTDVYQWSESEIRIMTDETETQPTRRNIEAGVKWLTRDASEGDTLWFSYSGHGGQQVDEEGLEVDGMNETLLPLDFLEAGMIPDNVLHEQLVQPLPDGCRLTVVIDACHSGSGLDLPYSWTRQGWSEEPNPIFAEADVIMISGCQDFDTSADASFQGVAAGALTTALLQVLKDNPEFSYSELLPAVHDFLDQGGYKQRPVLSSGQAFDFGRRFDLNDIMYNKNLELGRIKRDTFPPRPNKQVTDFLGSLRSSGAVGGIFGALGALSAMGFLPGCCGGQMVSQLQSIITAED